MAARMDSNFVALDGRAWDRKKQNKPSSQPICGLSSTCNGLEQNSVERRREIKLKNGENAISMRMFGCRTKIRRLFG
jgi:hypothetical protein